VIGHGDRRDLRSNPGGSTLVCVCALLEKSGCASTEGPDSTSDSKFPVAGMLDCVSQLVADSLHTPLVIE
jgi:hypothetical protein